MSQKVTKRGVDIGIIDECEPWKVQSRLFPSKVGGKPAWLDLEDLPCDRDLQCSTCNQLMLFLCQVYAPYEECTHNFHRTLFVFVCRSSKCCVRNKSDNIKVFRSQLRRQNKFYSEEPPEEKPDPSFTLSKWVKLCSLCGCLGNKHCSKCKEVYCCREHQIIDWKQGHKTRCGSSACTSYTSETLFPEYELTIEPESDYSSKVITENELKEFAKLEKEGKTGTLADVSETELESYCAVDVDETFLEFRKQISKDPDQVVRYERGGTPLWIAKQPKPGSIPNCEYCAGPRQFEFQIMPQMLTMLEEDEVDWGILVVYTCINSCVDKNRYKKEFIFKQDISEDNKGDNFNHSENL